MNHKTNLKALLLLGVMMYVALSALFTYSFEQGPNNRNVSVDARVNITNAPPQVLSVIIEDGATNITLNAGSQKNITCDAIIRDYNGGNTITNVTARLFHTTVLWNDSDDNNTHYTNASGTATSGCTITGFDQYTANATCGFIVQYHANVGFWTCNVTAVDPYPFGNVSRNNSLSNTTYIDPLLALNVTTLIDYGDLATGDVSAPQQANVTNLGNLNINLSVRGYGNTSSDNLSFICEVGNISVHYEKYNVIGGLDVLTYTNLSNVSTRVNGLTVAQQVNDSQRVINTTYWVVEIPPGPFGRCNGTVVFQAEYS